MNSVSVRIEVTMSPDHLRQFLQGLRDFDVAHDLQLEFQIGVDCPTMTSKQIMDIFDGIDPPFEYKHVYKGPTH